MLETSVIVYQPTRRHFEENMNLERHHCENPKSRTLGILRRCRLNRKLSLSALCSPQVLLLSLPCLLILSVVSIVMSPL
jgi:hypothetical protein